MDEVDTGDLRFALALISKVEKRYGVQDDQQKQTDMALSDALHKWWLAFKRKHPDAIPTPADAFHDGFEAARQLYKNRIEELESVVEGALAERES